MIRDCILAVTIGVLLVTMMWIAGLNDEVLILRGLKPPHNEKVNIISQEFGSNSRKKEGMVSRQDGRFSE